MIFNFRLIEQNKFKIIKYLFLTYQQNSKEIFGKFKIT